MPGAGDSRILRYDIAPGGRTLSLPLSNQETLMAELRIEKDSLGEIEVPAGAYYGAQTERARRNFPVSGLTLPKRFIASWSCTSLPNSIM